MSAALAFVQASLRDGEPRPDLCIVDQHLGPAAARPTAEVQAEGAPGQYSGWDFIAALRSLAIDCPVLMLSATPAQASEGWATAHGIDSHLLKPADQQLLLGTITEILGLQWDPPPRVGAAGPATAAVASTDTPVVPGTRNTEAFQQIWQALAAVAESGSLTDLEDWQVAHPGVYAVDARLQSMVQALDFAAIARHALSAQGRQWPVHPTGAQGAGPIGRPGRAAARLARRVVPRHATRAFCATAACCTDGRRTTAAETSRAQKATKVYPIGQDPRILALLAARDIAQAALDLATDVLNTASAAVRGALAAADFIALHGIDALTTVQEARFEGQLSAVNGGSVLLDLKLDYPGKATPIALDFSVKNPAGGARALGDKWLAMA